MHQFRKRVRFEFPRLAVTAILMVILVMTITASFPVKAIAQIKLHSEITPSSGNIDDLFIFTVTVEGTSSGEVPLLSGGGDFDLEFLGPRTSTLIVNGDVSSRSSFIYQLTPKREGELQTPAAELEWNGQRLSAPSIAVSIGRAATPHATPDAERDQPVGAKLSLQQSTSPSTVYQGQQVVHTTMFLSRVEISGFQLEDSSADGFWKEPLAQNERSAKVINGEEYLSVRFKDALFPLRTGNLTLPPRKLRAAVVHRVKRRSFPGFDLFGDDLLSDLFATAETKFVNLTSEPTSIQVKPLPPAPAEIAPLVGPVPIVGKTSIELDYPLEAIKVGEVKNIAVTVISRGNLNPLKALQVTPPDGVKVYEDRTESRSDKRGAELITHKIFRYSVVPLRPGLIKVPAFRVAYFDPESASFAVAQSPDVVFPVRGEAISGLDVNPNGDTAGLSPNRSSEDALRGPADSSANVAIPETNQHSMRYQEASFLETLTKSISIQLALLILSAVIAICFLASLFLNQRQRSEQDDFLANTTLAKIQDLRALEDFVRKLSSTRLQGVRPESTLDEIRALVTRQVADPELSLAIRSLLDDLEVLQYGGGLGPDKYDLSALRERVAAIKRQWLR
jgi:hypothetical protein